MSVVVPCVSPHFLVRQYGNVDKEIRTYLRVSDADPEILHAALHRLNIEGTAWRIISIVLLSNLSLFIVGAFIFWRVWLTPKPFASYKAIILIFSISAVLLVIILTVFAVISSDTDDELLSDLARVKDSTFEAVIVLLVLIFKSLLWFLAIWRTECDPVNLERSYATMQIISSGIYGVFSLGCFLMFGIVFLNDWPEAVQWMLLIFCGNFLGCAAQTWITFSFAKSEVAKNTVFTPEDGNV